MKLLKILGGLVAVTMLHCAFAAPVVTPTPLSTILQNLKSENYVAVRQVELSGDVYKVYAMNPQGKYTKLRVNAATGAIVSPTSATPVLSMLDVVQKVEGAGYSSISNAETSGQNYVIKAVNPQGQAVTLKVNSQTGVITQ